jgi:2-C-methyl-D-erythritol 4-phosphate cytidylyltransferase
VAQTKAAGVVLASGAGTRVGAKLNKVYLPVAGRCVVAWSLDAFARVPGIDVLADTRRCGGAVPGVAADDIVRVTENGTDGATLTGSLPGAIRVQTPQGFRAGPLLEAYEMADREGFVGTDTSSCMERFSALPVRWVPGSAENLKITYPHDLVVAEQVIGRG